MSNQEKIAFASALERYQQAIETIEKNQSTLNQTEIIDVLTSRDKIQYCIENHDNIVSDNIIKLSAFDKRLKQHGARIAGDINLSSLKKVLNHTTNHWWWTFEPPVDAWDRYDWVWNALTAGVLALCASFMVNIYSAFAAGNATIATALSTIVQAAGLIIVGGGAFTTDGQEKVKKILSSLNIAPRFHAEVTFMLTILLFVTVYVTNDSLDDVFLERGDVRYDQGYLSSAKLAYKQGIDINPDRLQFHQSLGKVYESLGQLKPAFEKYLIGSAEGNIESLNDLGRVSINHSNPLRAEAYLLMGLQRAQASKDTSPYLHYQLNRNLGWALVKQKKYKIAIAYLKKASSWRMKIGREAKRKGGMNDCFLGHAYEQEKETTKAITHWQKCIKYARPDYLHEYLWFLSIDKHDVAYCVNTEKVLAGHSNQRPENINKYCDALDGLSLSR